MWRLSRSENEEENSHQSPYSEVPRLRIQPLQGSEDILCTPHFQIPPPTHICFGFLSNETYAVSTSSEPSIPIQI